jgi:signal transduction histidine kinase
VSLAPSGEKRSRTPLAIQLVALLVASLVIAQGVTLAVVLLLPPPRPTLYRLTEVAEALRGGSLKPRFGRPLERSTETAPPHDSRIEGPWDGLSRNALAQLLGEPEARVRLVRHRRAFWWIPQARGRPPPGEFGDAEDPRGPPPVGEADRNPPPPLDRPGRPIEVSPERWVTIHPNPRGIRHGPEAAIFGGFTAAVQEASGRWVVVRPTPEPFPNDWQTRVSLWFLGSMIVVAPAGYLFARRLTAPLDRFAQAAESLGRDPRAPQMILSGPAELGKAASAFNQMQARLRRYVEDRTAMVGAISHDLRTPLARIRFKLESAPEKLKSSVLGDIAQMEQMIDGVLAFIRDASEPRRRERLDLLSLLECVVDDAALVGGDVEIQREEALTVDGDAIALQRLFGNLVDNALKYGGQARLRMRAAGGEAVIEIEDRGPGVPTREIERVFEPFYRSDRARNLDRGGVGLGLAVARSAARAHGGDVALQTGAEGLVAVVTLPLAKT